MIKSITRLTALFASVLFFLGAVVVPATKADAKSFKIDMGQVGYLENHVFLTGGLQAVDVTSTLVTANGVTTCTLNCASLVIRINYFSGIVTDSTGHVIGYTQLMNV